MAAPQVPTHYTPPGDGTSTENQPGRLKRLGRWMSRNPMTSAVFVAIIWAVPVTAAFFAVQGEILSSDETTKTTTPTSISLVDINTTLPAAPSAPVLGPVLYDFDVIRLDYSIPCIQAPKSGVHLTCYLDALLTEHEELGSSIGGFTRSGQFTIDHDGATIRTHHQVDNEVITIVGNPTERLAEPDGYFHAEPGYEPATPPDITGADWHQCSVWSEKGTADLQFSCMIKVDSEAPVVLDAFSFNSDGLHSETFIEGVGGVRGFISPIGSEHNTASVFSVD